MTSEMMRRLVVDAFGKAKGHEYSRFAHLSGLAGSPKGQKGQSGLVLNTADDPLN